MQRRGRKVVIKVLLSLFSVCLFLNIFIGKVNAIELLGDTFPEDVNYDGKVDQLDLDLVKEYFNDYKEEYDINKDGIIDIYDIVSISSKIGTDYIPYRVYRESTNSGNVLMGRFKSYDEAMDLAVSKNRASIVSHDDKVIWKGTFELYSPKGTLGRFNTLEEAIEIGNTELNSYIREMDDYNSIVWENSKPVYYGTVNATSLNVRSGPGTNYSTIGSLKSGNATTIVDNQYDGWFKIEYGTGYGYVSKDYVTLNSINKSYMGRKTIIIDAGHGGTDGGAVGYSGLKEKDVVLKVSKYIQEDLENSGYRVIMTRDQDVFITLKERYQISNISSALCFVSIHNNSYSTTSANGTETFQDSNDASSRKLATSVQNGMLKALGLYNRGVKTGNHLAVINNNNKPAVLAELAFLSNPTEEALLKDDEALKRVSISISKAIQENF